MFSSYQIFILDIPAGLIVPILFNAWVIPSTWSSCIPFGNDATSSIKSCNHTAFCGRYTFPDSISGVTALALTILPPSGSTGINPGISLSSNDITAGPFALSSTSFAFACGYLLLMFLIACMVDVMFIFALVVLQGTYLPLFLPILVQLHSLNHLYP